MSFYWGATPAIDTQDLRKPNRTSFYEFLGGATSVSYEIFTFSGQDDGTKAPTQRNQPQRLGEYRAIILGITEVINPDCYQCSVL